MKSPERIPLATAGNLQLMLPIYEQEITAIGFQPAGGDNVVPLTPIGYQANGSLISWSLGQTIPQDGTPYYIIGEGDLGAGTRVMDVGAPAGARVYAPVDGVVASIRSYKIKGQCPDVEIKIQPQAQSQMLVVLTHLNHPEVSLGQPVRAGVSRIGAVRGLEQCGAQPLGQYTYDNGNHLQIQVETLR